MVPVSIRRLAATLALSGVVLGAACFGAAAQCTGQFLAGTVCGNPTSAQGQPSAGLLSPLLDRNFGAPSAQGSVLNRGASAWTATTTPVLGNPGSITGTLGLSSSVGGIATIQPPAIIGNTSLQLPTTAGTFPSSATSPIVLNGVTGTLSCPTCVTGTGGALTINTTTVSGAAAGRVLFSDGALLQAYPITGTTNVVLSDSPTLTGTPSLSTANATSLTTPIVVGGTAANSTLTLESTSNGGVTDSIRLLTGAQIEAARIDTTQHVLVGGTSSQVMGPGLTPRVQITSGVPNEALGVMRLSSGATLGGSLLLGATDAGTLGNHLNTLANEGLGQIAFFGDTGTTYQGMGAQILGTADAAFSGISTPGRLTFLTTSPGSLSTTERLRITSTAHFEFDHGSGTPTIATPAACGNTATVSGTDTAGQLIIGSAASTSCTINFARGWTLAPYCTVTWASNLATMQYSISTTSLTITQTSTANNVIYYHCFR